MNKLIENYNEDSFRLTIRNVNISQSEQPIPDINVLD